MTKRQRERMLRDVALGGGVMLTTYGMLSNNWETLDEVECVLPPPVRRNASARRLRLRRTPPQVGHGGSG